MTTQSDAQWYIARDGNQHGPLSDAEMKKLVELSYLRPTDLIWRQGFSDWRPALAVFPQQQQPAAPAPAPAPTPIQPSLDQGFGHQHSYEPAQSHEPSFGTNLSHHHYDGDEEEGYDEPYKSGSGRRMAIAAIVLIALGVGGYLSFLNRDAIMSMAANMSSGSGGFTTGSIETPESVDDKLQHAQPWSFAKEKFPEWYSGQIAEVAKLTQEEKTDTEITKHLVSELVKFRRSNSDVALQAPTPVLKSVALTFRDTLVHFKENDINACYQFISHGETSDPIIEIMRKMNATSPVQKQIRSIFEAVAEGKKSPVQRETKVATDIQALTAELNNVGWTDADVKLFFDPKEFAKAPPERVCQMVQDLFTALLAIKDQGAQDRLLVETLRHVMAG